MSTEKIMITRDQFKTISIKALRAALDAAIDAGFETPEIALVHVAMAATFSTIEDELFENKKKENGPDGFESVREFYSDDRSRKVQVLAPEGVAIPDEVLKKVEKIAKELCEDEDETNWN
ncbi:MAG: hypothetical protein K6F23_14895 [Solobacterium sp.]|nr:hypothetical protein [Solobacterium sp.]